MANSVQVQGNVVQLRSSVLIPDPVKPPARYIPQLDGIRGIAVLAVMSQHIWGHWSLLFTNPFLEQVVKRGWIAVDLFFALSGFLITGILLRSEGKVQGLKTFYLKRAVRIWPLYFALLGFVSAVTYVLHQAYPILPFFFFVQNFLPQFPKPSFFDQTWSLCVEEHFYLVWPLCVLFFSRRWLHILLGIVIVGSPILRAYALHGGVDSKLLYTSTQYRLDGIALGSLLALLLSTYGSRVAEIRRFSQMMVAVTLPMMVWCLANLPREGLGFTSPLLYTLIAVVSAAFVAMAVSRTSGPMYKVLSWKGLRYVGQISYGLYMIHPFVFGAVRQQMPDIRGPVVATGLSVALACISWHLFESPLLVAIKARIEPQRASNATANC